MGTANDSTITVGELRRALAAYDDDTELSFGGLKFYRVKTRGDNLAQVEFNQSVYLNSKGELMVEDHE